MTTHQTAIQDPYAKRWKILPVVILSGFMATLDSSIVNVALPVMAENLGVGLNSIQWVVTSYLIAISAVIVLFGKLGDRFGKARVFLWGYLVFGIGSLMCGLSPNLGFLVFSRVVQAVGAAMFMASNQGLTAETFPANERGRALGFLGTAVAVGTLAGPSIGGFMVQYFNWQMIFYINIPVALIGLFAGKRLLHSQAASYEDGSMDIPGSLLFMVMIVALFWAFLSGEVYGWTHPLIQGALGAGALCATLFFMVERKAAHPMLELDLFRNSLFAGGLFCGFLSFASMFCLNIILPFYLQYILRLLPGQSGLLMMVFPLCVMLTAPVSGYLADRLGAERLTLVGLGLMTAGLVSMAYLDGASSHLDIILRTGIMGIGNGLFQSPNNVIIMSAVDREKMGIAGSINGLVRNVGMVTGISFSVVLLYNRMSRYLGYPVTSFTEGQDLAFLYGMKIVYMSAAAICFLGALLTFLRMRRSMPDAD